MWLPATENIDTKTFKAEMLKLGEKIVEFKPTLIIGNVVDMRFLITIELQHWVGQNFFGSVIDAGVKKNAMVMSSDMLTQLSVEQTIDEVTTEAFQTRYFDSEEKALN